MLTFALWERKWGLMDEGGGPAWGPDLGKACPYPFHTWPCHHSVGLRVTGKSLGTLQSGGWAHSRTFLQTFLGLCVCRVLGEQPGSSKHVEKTWAAGLFYLRESQSTRHKLSPPRFLTHTRSPEPTLAVASGSAGTQMGPGRPPAQHGACRRSATSSTCVVDGTWISNTLKNKSIFRVSRISNFAFPSNLPRFSSLQRSIYLYSSYLCLWTSAHKQSFRGLYYFLEKKNANNF